MLKQVVASLLLACSATAQTADEWAAVQIETVAVRDGVYMLVGRGGNIGLSVGSDGTFLVDDQYAPLTEKIVTAIEAVTDDPVRFLVNTHLHGDHTGGNENFGKRGAIIVAHDNVRERLSVEQFRTLMRNDSTPAAPAGALPKITFSDEVTFHWNGDAITAFHTANAHTDGDSIIHFGAANVFHMGDTFFNGMYPFIDVEWGGSVDGMIATAERVLALANSETRIIPGHGALAGVGELQAYRDMLTGVRDRVRTMVNDGKSLDDVLASAPTSAYDDAFTGNSERFIQAVYYSLTGFDR